MDRASWHKGVGVTLRRASQRVALHAAAALECHLQADRHHTLTMMKVSPKGGAQHCPRQSSSMSHKRKNAEKIVKVASLALGERALLPQTKLGTANQGWGGTVTSINGRQPKMYVPCHAYAWLFECAMTSYAHCRQIHICNNIT